MTIDRLSSLSAHIAALRAELSKKSGETSKKRKADAAARSDVGLVARRDQGELRRQLAELVRGVSVDETAELDNARRRVVRAVLLWEFGPELREHAEWQPMVEAIADTLAADERFRNGFNRLVMDLQV